MSAPSPQAWGEARSRFSARCFDPIRICLEALNQATWPSLEAINQVAISRGLANYRNTPLRFIAPSGNADSPTAVAIHYEKRIAALNGTYHINSLPGNGTTAKFEISFPA